jgi:hypothetical protein
MPADPPVKAVIRPSTRAGKKWMATFDGRKTVHFGAEGYEDFTQHGDWSRKQQYLDRHCQREDWSKDFQSPGFLSRWLLWNKPTLRGSLRDANQRFEKQARFTLDPLFLAPQSKIT